MKTKHTPGPWRVFGDDQITSVKGHDIARLQLPYATDSRTHRYSAIKNAQCEANGRVLALAPEMLELLEVISKFSSDGGTEGSLRFCETFKANGTIYGCCIGERILELIRKATTKEKS